MGGIKIGDHSLREKISYYRNTNVHRLGLCKKYSNPCIIYVIYGCQLLRLQNAGNSCVNGYGAL